MDFTTETRQSWSRIVTVVARDDDDTFDVTPEEERARSGRLLGVFAGAAAPSAVNIPLRIEVADNARTQISAAATWWGKHRPAAPDAIREELDRVLELLRLQPDIGTLAHRSTLTGVRRVTPLAGSLLRVLPGRR